jgi:hypothetical protein
MMAALVIKKVDPWSETMKKYFNNGGKQLIMVTKLLDMKNKEDVQAAQNGSNTKYFQVKIIAKIAKEIKIVLKNCSNS